MQANYIPDFPGTWGIVLSFAVLCLFYQSSVVIYNLYFHPLSGFPGPASRAGFYFGDCLEIFKGSHSHNVTELHKKYGDVVRIRPDSLTFATRAAWKDIYGSRSGKGELQKDPNFYNIEESKPHIVFSNDVDHSRMRKVMSPAFSDTALRQQESLFSPYFDLLVQQLQKRIDGSEAGVVDLVAWYRFISFDIIGDLCFGESFGALEAGEYHVWVRNIFQSIKFSRFTLNAKVYKAAWMVLQALIKFIPAVYKARREHEEFTELRTAKRLDLKTERKDFISYLLRYNDDRGMSRDEITGTLGILVIVGSENTTTLLSGLTYLLLKNPSAYNRAMKETRGSFKSAEEINFTSTAQLSYLQACVLEALRMYPPVPVALPRVTGPEGASIAGHFVPKHTTVGVHHLATYYSETNFFEPETFAPERWLRETPEQYRNDKKDAFNPFSFGPRNCIGQNLAQNEVRSVMARMFWHFDMELVDKDEIWTDQKIFNMWDKSALKVKFSHRKLT